MGAEERCGVPLAEAAERLGIREELVRQHIYRGKLDGYKVGRRWYVVLPDTPEGQDSREDSAADGTRQPNGSTRQGQDSLAAMAAHLASQEQQIAFLQGELTARTEELRRKDYIIADLTRRLPELPSPAAGSQPTEIGEDAQTGWWQRVHLWGRRAVSALVVAGND